MVLKPPLSEPIGIPAPNAPGAAPLEGELVGSNARSGGWPAPQAFFLLLPYCVPVLHRITVNGKALIWECFSPSINHSQIEDRWFLWRFLLSSFDGSGSGAKPFPQLHCSFCIFSTINIFLTKWAILLFTLWCLGTVVMVLVQKWMLIEWNLYMNEWSRNTSNQMRIMLEGSVLQQV